MAAIVCVNQITEKKFEKKTKKILDEQVTRTQHTSGRRTQYKKERKYVEQRKKCFTNENCLFNNDNSISSHRIHSIS